MHADEQVWKEADVGCVKYVFTEVWGDNDVRTSLHITGRVSPKRPDVPAPSNSGSQQHCRRHVRVTL